MREPLPVAFRVASLPPSRLPRLVEGIDLRALPIGPAEAFVLSHVDGATNESEIADESGIDPTQVATTLEALARLGAIQFVSAAPTESLRPPRPSSRTSGTLRIGPIIEASASAEQQHPAAALYDPRELEEAADLEPERKRVILDTFYRLDRVTHYQLLQVEPAADKRAIKNAYFQIVNVFHPDRYFGKSLGSFKPKLERVFTRLTEAHDALTRSGPRAEYDAYLASLKKTREFDQGQSDATVQAEVQAIQRQIEEEARLALQAASAEPPRSMSPLPVAPSSASQPRLPSQRPLDPEARKRALARKLGGRTLSGQMAAPVRSATPSPLPQHRSEASARAGEELKRRYEQRVNHAREQRAERYLSNARESLAKKDPVSAANSLRIAQNLVPENAELTARLLEAQTEAEGLLSGHYQAQAEYEEREGRLGDAARSYARAAIGNPSARIFERAAYCGLMAEGDLRLAGEHARKAVAAAGAGTGEEAQARVTLARIYVTAGMKQSGLAEFERAATLAPKDDTIKDWIRRLKRGEA